MGYERGRKRASKNKSATTPSRKTTVASIIENQF